MTKRPPTAHHVRQRERLLRVTRDLMAGESYSSIRLAEIASAADMSAPAIYSYFASRQDLFVEVVRRAIGSVLADIESSDDRDAPTVERLRTRFSRWSHHEGPSRAELLCVHRAFLDPRPQPAIIAALRNGIDATTAWFRDVIATGIERGEVPSSVDPRRVAEVVNASFIGIEMGSHHGMFAGAAGDLYDTMLDLVLARVSPAR